MSSFAEFTNNYLGNSSNSSAKSKKKMTFGELTNNFLAQKESRTDYGVTKYNELVSAYRQATDSASKDNDKWHEKSYYSNQIDYLKSLENKKKELENYFKNNGQKYSKDFLAQMNENLKNLSVMGTSLQEANASTGNFYSQWEDENSYNNWLSAEKIKKEQLALDIPTAKKEVEEIQSRLATLDNQIKGLKSNEKLLNFSALPQGQIQLNDPYTAYSKTNNAEMLSKYKEEYAKLSDELASKKQYLTTAERLQSNAKLVENAKNSVDFEQFSAEGLSLLKNLSNDDSLSDEKLRDLGMIISGNASAILDAHLMDSLFSTTGVNKTEDSKAKFDAMTEDEKKVYAYYLGKRDTENAKAYLENLDDTLNQRIATGIYEEQYQDNIAAEMFFGVKAGLNQNMEGMVGFARQLTGNEDYQAPSGTDYVSAFIRDDLGDEGAIHQGAYDLITTTSNMMPSILTSTLIGTIAPVAGKVVGAGMMGMSAAGGAYQEMINLGYNKEQARTYGTLVGASETTLESLLGGISKFGGALGTKALPKVLTTKFAKAADTAIGNIAIKYGSSMLSEFSEESLQEILDPVFQNIAVGYNLNKLSDIELSDVLYAGILGALSAGIFESPGVISDVSGSVNTAKIGQDVKKFGNINDLKTIANTLSADSAAYQIAGKVNEKSSAYTIGKLFNEVGATLSEGNVESIKNNLVSRGMSQNDAQVLAEAYANGVVNDTLTLTPEQEEVFKNNEVIASAVHEELISKNKKYNEQLKRYIEITDNVLNKRVAEPAHNSTESTAEKLEDIQTDNSNNTTENASETDFSKTTYNGEEVSYKYKSHNAVQLDNGETVDIEDLSLSDDDAFFYETVTGENDILPEARFVNGKLTGGVDVFTANEIREIFGGTPTPAQLKGVGMYFRYGMYNINRVDASVLTDLQRKQVFNMGRAFGEYLTENESKKTKVKQYTKGKVKYNIKNELNTRQQASVEVIEKLADMFNITFNLYESTLNENGERLSVMPDGKETTANGYYMNGEIYIDINAGNEGQGAMLYTAAHELTHYIKESSPKKFKVLADFLVEQYQSKGKNVEYYVNKQMEKARRAGNKDMKYSEAFEEFVADSMEKMLADENAVEKLVALRIKDKTVFDKLREGIKKLVDRIKQEYAKLAPDSEEGRTVAKMTDVFSDIQDLFLEALDDASNNFQKAEKNTITNDGVKMQARQIDANGNSYWQIETEKDIFANLTKVSELKKAAFNFILNGDKGDKVFGLIDGKNLEFIRVSAKEYVYGVASQLLSTEEYKQKMRMSTSIIDLVENASITYDSPDKKNHKLFPNGFKNYQGRVGIDETIFKYIVRIGKAKDGVIFYDINLEVDGKVPRANRTSLIKSSTSNNSVSQEDTTVNNNSMQEDENNTQKKFSLRENVEETKDLVAVHNLSAEKLLKSLNLGGLPMPSIAIMKAKDGHNQFGDISLVFRKDTIDPESDKSNKVYSGDAWTPTYPQTEYKVNEDIARKIYHRARSAGETTFFNPVHFYPDNIVGEVNSFGGIEGVINHYKNDHSMKQFYLAETSEPVQMIMGEERNELSKQEIEQFDFVINALGKDNILKLNTEGYSGRNWMQEFGEKYKTALVKYYRTTAKASVTDEEIREIVESQKAYEHASNVKRIKKYIESGPIEVTPVQDYKATQKEIDNRVNQDEYIAWLTELFDGLVEKSGIRNNVDPYTSRGDKKSFEATHYVENLENVVKAMKEQQDVGNSFLFSGLGIWGVAAKRFNSIDEIKADSNRLVGWNEELFSEVKRSIGGKLTDIADTILNPRESNYFIARDDAIN